MAGAAITIDIDDGQVLGVVRALLNTLEDPQPAFRDAGEYLVRSTHDRFEAQHDPSGHPWAPLSQAYRERKPKNKDLILVLNAYLYNDIHYQADRQQLLVGTNRIYGATMQFGDDSRDIPARPFLGLSEADRTEVISIFSRHIRQAV